MNNTLMEQLNALLEETAGFSFPVFTSKEKKEEMIKLTREEIDHRVASLLHDASDFDNERDNLWEAAIKSAMEEFETLPENLKVNSFYYQEVMHRYVELIIGMFE